MISSSVMAQNTLDTASKNSGQETTAKADTLPDIMKEYMILKLKPEGMGYRLDTVSILYERYIGVLDYLNDPTTPERYIPSNPNYYRLFLPLTYYYAPMRRLSKVDWHFQVPDTVPALTREMLPFDTLSFTSKDRANKLVDRTLLNTYVNCPNLVVMTEKEVMKGKIFKDNIEKEVSPCRRLLFSATLRPCATGYALCARRRYVALPVYSAARDCAGCRDAAAAETQGQFLEPDLPRQRRPHVREEDRFQFYRRTELFQRGERGDRRAGVGTLPRGSHRFADASVGRVVLRQLLVVGLLYVRRERQHALQPQPLAGDLRGVVRFEAARILGHRL